MNNIPHDITPGIALIGGRIVNPDGTPLTHAIAGTGHRPLDIAAALGLPRHEAYGGRLLERLIDTATVFLEAAAPNVVLSGMAQGWDQALCHAARRLGIPYIAVVPCRGQESRWGTTGPSGQAVYRRLVAEARDVVTLESHYSDGCMNRRNVPLIASSTQVLALWSGKTSGGTADAIRIAQRHGIPVVNAWARLVGQQGLDV